MIGYGSIFPLLPLWSPGTTQHQMGKDEAEPCSVVHLFSWSVQIPVHTSWERMKQSLELVGQQDPGPAVNAGGKEVSSVDLSVTALLDYIQWSSSPRWY